MDEKPENPTPKPWYNSKTVRVNVLVIIGAILTVLLEPGLVKGESAAYITAALALVNVALRSVTDEPVTFKKVTPVYYTQGSDDGE